MFAKPDFGKQCSFIRLDVPNDMKASPESKKAIIGALQKNYVFACVSPCATAHMPPRNICHARTLPRDEMETMMDWMQLVRFQKLAIFIGKPHSCLIHAENR